MSSHYYSTQAVAPQAHYPGAQGPTGYQSHHGQYTAPMYGGYGAVPGAPQYPPVAYPYAPQQNNARLGFANDRFLKGLLIGAAATYLMTNESVQKTAIKSAVRVWSFIQGGVEEMKERFHDAEAEIQAAETAEK